MSMISYIYCWGASRLQVVVVPKVQPCGNSPSLLPRPPFSVHTPIILYKPSAFMSQFPTHSCTPSPTSLRLTPTNALSPPCPPPALKLPSSLNAIGSWMWISTRRSPRIPLHLLSGPDASSPMLTFIILSRVNPLSLVLVAAASSPRWTPRLSTLGRSLNSWSLSAFKLFSSLPFGFLVACSSLLPNGFRIYSLVWVSLRSLVICLQLIIIIDQKISACVKFSISWVSVRRRSRLAGHSSFGDKKVGGVPVGERRDTSPALLVRPSERMPSPWTTMFAPWIVSASLPQSYSVFTDPRPQS